MNDLRLALRRMAKSPGFAALAIAIFALGIGASVAIFSVVDGVLLRPLPYPRSDRLVVLREVNPPRFPGEFVRPQTYRAWKEQATVFENLAFIRDGSYNLTGIGAPIHVNVGRTTANTFSTLGASPILGRDFRREEDVAGTGNVVILSHGFWQRRFGARQDVLQQTITLDGQPFSVIGVMPAGFTLGHAFDLFTPGYGDRRDESANQLLEVVGRLKPDVTLEQARQEMALVAGRLARQDPGRYKGWGARVEPMLDARVAETKPALFSLLGAVGFLLLIACANVANLLLSRAIQRSREMAVRSALGATRGHLVRQLLVEGVLLAVVGAGVGVLVAHLGLDTLLALAPDGLPRAQEIGIDGRAIGLSCALAMLTGIGFGLVPAIGASRVQLGDALRTAQRGSSDGHRSRRMRAGLVVAEVAIALVLLVGAGLFIRSLAKLQEVDLGYRPDGVLVAEVTLPEQRYRSGSERAALVQQVVKKLAAIPGVRAAGATQRLPFLGSLNLIHVKAAGRPERSQWPVVNWHAATPGFFSAMGIPLRRGRSFDDRDGPNAPLVVIINESMARRYFPGEDPIGKRIAAVHRPQDWAEVVGVVGDVTEDIFDGGGILQAYGSFAQDPYLSLTFALSSSGPVRGVPAEIRKAIHSVDAGQAIASLRPATALAAASIARHRFVMFLLIVFSAAGLLLAVVGIYGAISYSVSQRFREIGIRMALGAHTTEVLRLFLAQGGRLVGTGMLIGIAGALALTRFLTSMLFDVSAYDPLTFVGITLLLSMVAAAACLLPAARAAKLAPMSALRAE